jgi:dipeptidyl-peptidase-4
MIPAPLGSRRNILSRLLITIGCMLVCHAVSAATEPATDKKPNAPRFDPVKRSIEGWSVLIDPSLLDGPQDSEDQRAIAILANHLQRISILVTGNVLTQLRTIPIWIEKEHPSLRSMQYHPSKSWLENNGHDPRLTRHVHIPVARHLLSRGQLLKHPAVVLHELAHGFHDQILSFDEPRIIAAFEDAKRKDLYANVLLYTGKRVRHYGLTNHKEYFAEGTEAFLYRNDFFPFVRAELQEYDPTFHDILESIWGKPE